MLTTKNYKNNNYFNKSLHIIMVGKVGTNDCLIKALGVHNYICQKNHDVNDKLHQ